MRDITRNPTDEEVNRQEFFASLKDIKGVEVEDFTRDTYKTILCRWQPDYYEAILTATKVAHSYNYHAEWERPMRIVFTYCGEDNA